MVGANGDDASGGVFYNVMLFRTLRKVVLSIDVVDVCFIGFRGFHGGEIDKVRRTVTFVIKFFRVGELQRVLHTRAMLDAHKVVVPASAVGDHVVAQETV